MRLHYLKFLSVLFIVLTFSSTITSQVVSTYAGSGNYGYLDSVASIAKFFNPWAVCSDVLGNVYVGDGNNVVRKISPSGQVTTFAGTGATGSLDGQGNTATFYYPRGLCSDSMGNIYVSDQWNHKIRKISPAGIVSTFAGNGTMGNSDGQGQSASFQYPAGLCIDKQGNIYVADNANQRIRKITPSGFVSTLAGSSVGYVNGTGSAARFYSPQNLCADSVGNIYVTDSGNDVIRKISPLGVVTTFAGSGVLGNIDGLGSTAAFDVAWGICIDKQGTIFITDANNNKIRKITPSGMVSTYAGSGAIGSADGNAASASFHQPWSICTDPFGAIFIADQLNHKIRKLSCIVPTPPFDLTQPSNKMICVGQSTTLTALGSGSITWFLSPSAGAAINSGPIFNTTTNLSTGVNTYYAQDNTCIASASRTAISYTVNACLGQNSVFENEIRTSVYPNPSTGNISVQTGHTSPKNIELIDACGRVIMHLTDDSNTVTVDLTKFQDGFYFLKVSSNELSEQHKIILKASAY